jgi:GTP-binding protein EngB required for normal cell division
METVPSPNPVPLREVVAEIQRIYGDAVDPVASRFAFERRPGAGEIKGPPTVLLLGNHSSGKSTFINHLLGEDVQRTGLAPTDDSFTVLGHAAREDLRDGEAVTSNPELPYTALRSFGPDLLSHLQMKLRPIAFLEKITLIDSPGMIDTPGLAREKDRYGRGYDFAGVVRWFADHADLVLVFFDPDKPGTTGETLEVFTDALRGNEHKVLIVLHKVDQCENVRDFARAYGALCWNLAKVIPRKDLPNIYTTYVQVANAPSAGLPREDFEHAREELIEEVLRAPARRGDNALTQLATHAERLLIHASVASEARRDLKRHKARLGFLLAAVVAAGIGAGAGALYLAATWQAAAAIWGGTVLATAIGLAWIKALLPKRERELTANLQGLFTRLRAHELLERERAEDLWAHWHAVAPRLRKAIETLGLRRFPILRAGERRRLERVLSRDVPALRAKLLAQSREPAKPVAV